MAINYDDELEKLAKNPKSATVDGVSATAQDVDAIIKIQDRAAAKTAASRNHFGLRLAKIEPPGAG